MRTAWLPRQSRLFSSKASDVGETVLVLLLLASGAPGGDLNPVPDYRPPEYHLGGGDQIRVITFGEDQLTGDFRVDNQSHIALPLMGSVPVAGLTIEQVDQVVADGLRAHGT